MTEREIFAAALNLAEPAQRAAFLDEQCAGDAPLRRRIEALLAEHEQLGSFMEVPSPAATIDQPAERPGTQIGPYKLLQQIGEGGMGVVYMAEQTEPVKRRVALKIIKPGMDTRQVIARFEAERQALSLMDHPNIAKVLDAGTIGEPGASAPGGPPPAYAGGSLGRPYFVMELVKGQPITQYCDEKHLTPRQRLELLLPVCQAIQHAHQKGIIHRDIKPTNILVAEYDQQPVPKVIDFGVAKATSQTLTEKTMFTGLGQIVGTLEYMSPEQAKVNQLDIDTRSDIYSLGVLMYELLTGSTPFDRKRLRSAAFDEMLRIIREEEPPKPSTRLSDLSSPHAPRAGVWSAHSVSGNAGSRSEPATLASVAALRHTEPAKLTKLVRGELDWIVMKALEKDRNRRYETANGFAMDVQRYLADETVMACPPSAGYRLRKFARRNKRSLAVAGLVLFFIVLFGGGGGWVLRDRSTRLATTERESESALAEATKLAGQRKWPEALAWVQRAEGVLAHGGGSAALQQRVQDLRKDLEMVAKLEEIQLDAAEVKVDNFDFARKGPAYAAAFREYGIDVNALGAEEAARRIRASIVPVELAAALDDWARGVPRPGSDDNESRHLTATARLADPDRWRNRFRDAIEQRDHKVMKELAASDEIDQMPAPTLHLLGYYLRSARADDLRLTMLRRAQRRHPDDFWANTKLGICLNHEIKPTRPQEAVRFFTAAVALRPRSPGAHLNLGSAFNESGAYEEAVAAYREAIRLKPDYAAPYYALGDILRRQNKNDEAIDCYRTSIDCCRKVIELNPKAAFGYIGLGAILCDVKHDYEGAIAAFREAIALDPKDAEAQYNLGNALSGKGSLDEAIVAYREAIRLKPDLAMAHDSLGNALAIKGRFEEAVTAFREAVRHKPDLAKAHHGLGESLARTGALDEAIAAYREAIRLKLAMPALAAAHLNLGVALRMKGRFDEAVAAFREAIRLKPDDASGYHGLGAILCDHKHDYEGAIAAFREALRLQPNVAGHYANLGNALRGKGALDEAITAYREAIRLKPDDASAYYHLGEVLCYYKHDADGAIAAFREAVRLDPNVVVHHHGLGDAFLVKGALDEAIAAYKVAIRIDARWAAPHGRMGIALKRKGAFAAAIVSYEKSIELAPKAIEPINNLAWLLATCPDPKYRDGRRAVELAKKAVDLDKSNGAYWQTLAWAQYRAGDWKAAIAALEKVKALGSTGDSTEWFLLAMANWRLGNNDEARRWYAKAVEWMDKNQPKEEEIRRFRAEAAELLGVKEKMK